jgi:nucleolar protein 53
LSEFCTSFFLSSLILFVFFFSKMPTKAPKSAEPAPLFEIDSRGSSTVRSKLLAEHYAEANPASAKIAKGTRIARPLRSQEILAQRSNVPSISSRVKLPSVAVPKKERESGKIRPELKRRLERIARRNRKHTGRGLFDAPAAPDIKGELSEAVRRAGEYDVWQPREEPKVEEDIRDLVVKSDIKVCALFYDCFS